MATEITKNGQRGFGWLIGGLAIAAFMSLVPARPEAAGPIGCGDLLIGDRTYTLTADVLDCNASLGPAITVVGPAKLRLNGYTVSCEHTIELKTDPKDSTRPFPHTVTGTKASIGIALDGTEAELLGAGHHTRSANTDPENRVLGCDNNVVIGGNGKHHVEGVHSIQSGETAFLVLSDENELEGNVVRQQFLDDPTLQLGLDPRPALCEKAGYVVEGNSNTLSRNIGADCRDNGFEIDGSANRLEDNIARDNVGYGFEIDGTYNDVDDNRAMKNLKGGFTVGCMTCGPDGAPVYGNTLDHNVSSQNGDGEPADGFEILGAENTLKANTADKNGRYGIFLSGGQDNIVKGNAASQSADTDLFDETGACGSNRWASNIFGTKNESCIK